MGPLHTLPADVSAWKVAGGRAQHKDDLILRIQWLWPKDSRENIVGRGLVLCLGLLLFSHSVMSNSLRPCGLQHARLPCSSPSPGVCSYSYPLSRWCHPTILSSVAPFSCPQSFLAWKSLPMSRLNLYAMSVKYVYFNVCVSEITSSDCNVRTREQIFCSHLPTTLSKPSMCGHHQWSTGSFETKSCGKPGFTTFTVDNAASWVMM